MKMVFTWNNNLRHHQVRKIRFLSKLQYGSITGSQIMWQACADLRLQGHLSERTKQQLLKLESSSINSGQDFISSDLLLSTNAGNVDAADLEAIMPDDPVLLQEELKHLRAELQITKLELLQANMLAEDPELARQHQHGSMLDSLGASSNFLIRIAKGSKSHWYRKKPSHLACQIRFLLT